MLATSKNPRKLAQMKLSDAHDWTALHLVFLSNPPLFLVYALLLVFPEGAKEVDNAGRLPLHLAAGSETGVCALNTLVRFNNEAICSHDDRGYIPLHLALLRDGNEEIPMDVLRILLGQTTGSGKAAIQLGGTIPRGVRDGYMRNKEHLNLELDDIQGGLLGVSRGAAIMKERKRREAMMKLSRKKSHEPLSRGFARNIEDADSQDGDPLKHEHLSSLWANDAHYQSDPFGDMELVETNQFSSEVQHCLKQLAQWKKRYDREQKTETSPNLAPKSHIVNPATIPAPPYSRLPLHMAVRRNHKKKSQEGSNANTVSSLAPPPNQNEILRILIHAFPPSLMIKDSHDKTPLMTCLALVHHPAIHPVDLNMIELLLGTRTLGYKAAPRWLEDIDFFRQHQKSIGRHAHEIQQNSTTLATNAAMIPCDETLPLHIAAREALSTSIVHTIYTSYPGAKYAQDERDSTPLHCTLQNLTGRTSLNLEMIYMLMDDKVLRIRNSMDQSIFDLLVANAKANKLPTKFKDKSIKHAETGKRVKVTTIFQPVFHQVIMDEVLGSGERKEDEFLSELYSLPSTMRRQACATPSFQYVLLKELATGANAASIFLYGICLLTLTISFSAMVDTFISHRSDDDVMTSNAQKNVIFVTNAYLSIHGLMYACMTIRLNISIAESLANIWTWITFIALLLSLVVTVYIGNQERSLGSIDVTDSHLITMSTIAIGTLWSAFIGYLARWWYGVGIFCASVVKVRIIRIDRMYGVLNLYSHYRIYALRAITDGKTPHFSLACSFDLYTRVHANGVHYPCTQYCKQSMFLRRSDWKRRNMFSLGFFQDCILDGDWRRIHWGRSIIRRCHYRPLAFVCCLGVHSHSSHDFIDNFKFTIFWGKRYYGGIILVSDADSHSSDSSTRQYILLRREKVFISHFSPGKYVGLHYCILLRC
jgi:hypothetical protein